MTFQEFSAYCITIFKEFEETLYPLLPFEGQPQVGQNQKNMYLTLSTHP